MTKFAMLLVSLTMLVRAADPVDAVREAASGWRQGAVHQDAAALNRFLADDLVYTHGGGKHQTKAEYIHAETHGPPAYESFAENGPSAIRVYGDVAVLTGLVDVKPTGKPAYQVHTFEVYVQKNGHWQLAQKESVHVTP
jgi:ketosteroid isomerase-like protein